MTDTFLRAMYGYASGANDAGVLLASYTWEDDANKLVEDDSELARRCTAEVDRIFQRLLDGPQRFSDRFIDMTAKPRIVRWARELDYRGCAKLYRSNCSVKDYTLLTFNHEYAKHTGIYFAGEAFSVEGGWTEPALRLALDAVICLIEDQGGEWEEQFQSGYRILLKDHLRQLREEVGKPPVMEARA
jgi:tryptophan 2-monooxygenase